MTEMNEIIQRGKRVFEIEIAELQKVMNNLDHNFYEAIELILKAKGKLIITGMGKSGIIAKKIASTLSSVGTLSVFLHPAEGLHGDLGMIAGDDVVVMLGKSGESDEVLGIIPVIKKIGAKIISITGNVNSTMAKYSDVVLDASVEMEACNMNIAPTSSTTTALVMGDALATVLSHLKNFKEENYALYHPGGRIGRRFLYEVKDFMIPLKELALGKEADPFKDILIKMTANNLGACLILGKDEELLGIITDGDVKRILTKYDDFKSIRAAEVMSSNPKIIDLNVKAYEAQLIMQKNSSFSVLPVVENGKVKGLLRLFDILNARL